MATASSSNLGPPSLLSNGKRGAISLGVKRPELQADHSSPCSAEAKNVWSYEVIIS
jgi:hypothetical protein